jgi:hypothetical protein
MQDSYCRAAGHGIVLFKEFPSIGPKKIIKNDINCN